MANLVQVDLKTLVTNNDATLGAYLRQHTFIADDEQVLGYEKPGEGNMNYTVRVRTNRGSIITKQANAYVQKYPQIPAPQQRVLAEANFYNLIKGNEHVAGLMPALIGVDEDQFLIALEDLGTAKDMTNLYAQGMVLQAEQLEKLCAYLSTLHTAFTTTEVNELMANRALRALNYEHIFVYPLMEQNGLDLDIIQPGLAAVAAPYKADAGLKAIATKLGENYMADGATLLHGDFYPGSWLQAGDEIKVIDPEFCFYGSPEFDVAVLSAHLMMAQQPENLINAVFSWYQKPEGFNEELFQQYTGIEIMRRIIGLAQLPLSLSVQEKSLLLTKAASMLGAAIK